MIRPLEITLVETLRAFGVEARRVEHVTLVCDRRGAQVARVYAVEARPPLVAADKAEDLLPGLPANGASRARTGDLLGAIQALFQLSYSPACVAGRIVPALSHPQG